MTPNTPEGLREHYRAIRERVDHRPRVHLVDLTAAAKACAPIAIPEPPKAKIAAPKKAELPPPPAVKPRSDPRVSPVSFIIEATAAYYGLSSDELRGNRRLRPLIKPRHVAMYLARRLTDASFPEISYRFGGRDHTTVLYACQKMRELANKYVTIRLDLEAITEEYKLALEKLRPIEEEYEDESYTGF